MMRQRSGVYKTREIRAWLGASRGFVGSSSSPFGRAGRSPCHVAVLEPRADAATVTVCVCVCGVGLPVARLSALPFAPLSALAAADCLLGRFCSVRPVPQSPVQPLQRVPRLACSVGSVLARCEGRRAAAPRLARAGRARYAPCPPTPRWHESTDGRTDRQTGKQMGRQTRQTRTGQDLTGAGQDRAGQDRTGQGKADGTRQRSTAQHNRTRQRSTAQHSTAQHRTRRRSTAHHNRAQHNTPCHNTTKHNTTRRNITRTPFCSFLVPGTFWARVLHHPPIF